MTQALNKIFISNVTSSDTRWGTNIEMLKIRAMSLIVYVYLYTGWSSCLAVRELAAVVSNKKNDIHDRRAYGVDNLASLYNQINEHRLRDMYGTKTFEKDFDHYLAVADDIVKNIPFQAITETDKSQFKDNYMAYKMLGNTGYRSRDIDHRLFSSPLRKVTAKRSEELKRTMLESGSKHFTEKRGFIYNSYLHQFIRFLKIRNERRSAKLAAPVRPRIVKVYRRYDTFDSLGSGLIGK